jgi:uncharacterized protein YacL
MQMSMSGIYLFLGLFFCFCAGVGLFLGRFLTRRMLWGMIGFLVGGFISVPMMHFLLEPIIGPFVTFSRVPYLIPSISWQVPTHLFFSYLGVVLALKVEKDPRLLEWRRNDSVSNLKLLDTSVIIDGRIADLCETGFLEGTYIIPQFVLHELQYVADSGDPNKRVRGKRGLDILHRLQKMENFDLKIVDDDFPAIREVDAKLVALARKIQAKIVTNDMNLNKVAGLQGVFVLNINQLTNALKPVVLPGETMRVFVLKEGKESWQGVAYLDDGTMIVIDDARKSIGKKVEVSVTSVLQTAAGRMIFAKLKEEVTVS